MPLNCLRTPSPSPLLHFNPASSSYPLAPPTRCSLFCLLTLPPTCEVPPPAVSTVLLQPKKRSLRVLPSPPESERFRHSTATIIWTGVLRIMAFRSLLLLAIAFLPLASCNSEGDALHAFRRSLSDPDNVLQSWDPTLVNPCTWFHVTCNQDNHVTRVDLGNSNLSGRLVRELGNLQHLQYLELYKNRISGKLPEELGKLKNLVSLDLYNNGLTGEMPSSFGGLKSLVFLRLNNNKLTGQIPRALVGIGSLKVIDVSNNDLCGTIPTSGAFQHVSLKSFENNPRLNGPELLGSVAYHSGCK